MNITEILKSETPNRCLKHLVAFDPVKRLLALSIIGLLAVSATFHAHAAVSLPYRLPAFHADAHAIRNGGFETGDLTGWTTMLGFDGGVTSAEAAGGSYSLELEPGDIVYQDLDQDLEIFRHFNYLGIYAKADDKFRASISAYVTIQYSDGTWKTFDFGSSFYTDAYWNKFSVVLDGTKRVARVWFVVPYSTPTPIYIDNVWLHY